MRNRVLVIIGVIALSIWITYPLQDSLELGLDLNGGVQLVLRVKTDEALTRQGLAPTQQLRDEIVAQALRTIDRRVNDLGVTEPEIARYTGADH